MPGNSAGRLARLETLRGVASLAVVFHHIAQQLSGDLLVHSAGGRLLLWLGGWGVTVFFVLSGFCIHGSVLRHNGPGPLKPDWRRYALHRARRILPGYFTCLALSCLLGAWAGSPLINPPWMISVLAHATFLSSFRYDTALGINSVLWTVVVEVHFYLFYPLFVRWRNAVGVTRLALLLLALSFAIKAGGRLWLGAEARWTWHHLFLNLWWIWALGALLAEIYAGRIARPRWAALWQHQISGVLIVAASVLVGCIDGRLRPDLWLVVESYLLPLLAAGVVGVAAFSHRPLPRQPLTGHLGLISYSMYLFHPAALWVVFNWLPSWPVAGLALAWLLAEVGYHWVERPFLKR